MAASATTGMCGNSADIIPDGVNPGGIVPAIGGTDAGADEEVDDDGPPPPPPPVAPLLLLLLSLEPPLNDARTEAPAALWGVVAG